jgi:hypothetical protein
VQRFIPRFYMNHHFLEVGGKSQIQHGRSDANQPGGKELCASIQKRMTIVVSWNRFHERPPFKTRDAGEASK